MAESQVKRGRGRPREGAESRSPLSVYVPDSTIARIRSHAEHTGQTVSDVVAAILAAADLGDLPPRDTLDLSGFGIDPDKPALKPRHIDMGGYDPLTGSY